MPLNTTILSLNYRKFSGVIPSQNIEVTFTGMGGKNGSISGNFRVNSKPAWAKIILEEIVYVDGNAGRIEKLIVKVAIDPNYANNLPVGYLQEKATISYYAQIDGSNNNGYQYETFNINLRVTEDVRLSLSKTLFWFRYKKGESLPGSQFLTITAANNWSIVSDEPWLSFSSTNGSGKSVISLSVDPAGIDVFTSKANFVVDDGDRQMQGSVYLGISGTGDEADYLMVTPNVLQFSETYLEPSAKEHKINIDSSLTGTIESNVTWLEFSTPNVVTGVSQITVNTVNTNLLQVGAYPAEIKIITNYGVNIIEVLLNVVQITTAGIVSNGFYYAEDRNTLSLTSGTENSEILADFKSFATFELKRYRKRAPFNKNSAQLIIGLETNLYLRPQALPPVLISQGFTAVKPMKMDIALYERSLTTAATTERNTYDNLLFLNGNTPNIANRLAYIPNNITIPKDGIITFSFKSDDLITEAKITGAVNATFPLYFDDSKVYSVFINANDFGLEAKDNIVISCGPILINATIKPTQLPTTHLIWLNEWDCPEVFNMDGTAEVIKENESKVIFTNRNGKEYASVIESKEPKSFKIGTGNIYSDAEVEHLGSILSAKKIWLQIGSSRIEVLRNFRSLSISETRRHNNNYTLSFDAAEK